MLVFYFTDLPVVEMSVSFFFYKYAVNAPVECKCYTGRCSELSEMPCVCVCAGEVGFDMTLQWAGGVGGAQTCWNGV